MRYTVTTTEVVEQVVIRQTSMSICSEACSTSTPRVSYRVVDANTTIIRRGVTAVDIDLTVDDCGLVITPRNVSSLGNYCTGGEVDLIHGAFNNEPRILSTEDIHLVADNRCRGTIDPRR
ncbi:hypothetical protein D3C81_974650 [compost metagenome]